MRRRTALAWLGTAAVGGSLASTIGEASPEDMTFGRSWPDDEESLEAFHDYEELMDELRWLEERTLGSISIRSIGTSNQGRSIPMASAGKGDIDVLLCSQQHGHEPTGTETLLRLLKRLSAEYGHGGPLLQALEEVTVHAVVRANPDGGEPDVFTRFNVDEDAPFRDPDEGLYTAYSQAGIGWDINRYHWFDWTESELYQNRPEEYPENPVPEAQAIVDVVEELDPLWMVDMHNQLTYRTDDGDIVSNSVYWPTHEDVPDETRRLGKRLCRAAFEEADRFGNATVTSYPGGNQLGIARNSHGVAGVACMLLETRGHMGQEALGRRIRNEFAIVTRLIEATADGSLFEIDPALAEDIPERGERYNTDLPPTDVPMDQWVDASVSTAMIDWEILNDAVACSVDGRFLERLPVDVGGTLLVRNDVNDQVRPYHVARTHDEGGARAVRIGANARERFYEPGDNVPTRFDSAVRGYDPDPWALLEVRPAQLEWEILNDAEACSIEESFLTDLPVSVGDRIRLQNNDTERERTFTVARTHHVDDPHGIDDGERRVRMGLAARSRFYESDESVPSSFVGKARPA
ncbi:M14 family zinc carboxypeptidase [Halostagnicola kamekurae]|uniref:Zinc carboxypeptidase n=1 Tax=Halostagnicola kamekurae TaxID=619731 RepID=A0A1I6SBV1_9EURY|nr:M14 family zinc carboxypeptidase [Halostagnicola kamekurae]SFS74350.1 Zinc carboxypeptidase [Halostagnicola kamekurae]